MYELSVKSKFSSAHFLREYEGKCENLHGHNWQVEAVLKGSALNAIGLLIDFKEAKQLLNEVLDFIDHKLINDIEFFKTTNPSCENLAKFLFEEYSRKVNRENVKLYKMIVWETDGSAVAFVED